jgi:hypothetical protein
MRQKKEWALGLSGARLWPKTNSPKVGYSFLSKFDREYVISKVLGGGKYEIYSDGVYLERSLKEIKSGQIKHPLDRTVYSRGFLGVGSYTYEENKHRSDCWRAMFKRCYSGNDFYVKYANLEVCELWFNFQNFAEWYDINYSEGYDLDKDLKSSEKFNGYSPETCVFLPHDLNKRLSHQYKTVPTKERHKYRAKVSFKGEHFELGRYLDWSSALYFQVAAKFAMLEQEIRGMFGNDFVEKYWNQSRFDVCLQRSYEIASA